MKFLILLYAIFLVIPSFAQRKEIDSLLNKLTTNQTDTSRVNLFNEIASKYTYVNLDSSKQFNQKAHELSLELNYSKGFAEGYHQKALYNFLSGEYKEAIVWWDSARVYRQKINDNEGDLRAAINIASANKLMGNRQAAIQMYYQILKKALAVESTANIMLCRYNIGAYHFQNKNLDSALYHYELTKEVAQNSNDKLWLIRANIGIADTYYKQANYFSAFKQYRTTLDLATELENNQLIDRLNGNIAFVYFDIGLTKKAIEVWKEMLKKYQKAEQKIEVVQMFQHLALAHSLENNYKKGIEYALEGIRLQSSADGAGLTRFYSILGNSYLKLDSLELARKYYDLTYQSAIKYKNTQYQAIALSGLGELSLINRKYKEAKEKSLVALDLLGEKNVLQTYKAVHGHLAKSYKALGEFNNAYKHLEIAMTYQDSILNEEKANAMISAAIEFETEKKEQALIKAQKEAEIQALELEKKDLQITKTILISIAGAILLISLGIILYLNNVRKQLHLKTEAAIAEQRLLRVQMNPHFIFNALAAIQNYMNKVDIDKANLYMAKFSKLIRQTLENSRTEFIPLTKEVESIENYLSLQSLYRKNQFEYQVKIEDIDDLEDLLVPPMFTQPFAENAIEHGIPNDEKGRIEVLFSQQGNEVKIEIQDSGSNDKTELYELKKGYKSLAEKITKERIRQLNKQYKLNARFDISHSANGTLVQLLLPLREAY